MMDPISNPIGAIGGLLAFLPVFFSPLRSMRELPGAAGEEEEVASAPTAA